MGLEGMTLSPADVEAVAEAVVRRMASSVAGMPIPLSAQHWTPAQCASYMQCSPRNFTERVAKTPGFPRPIRVSLPNGSKSRPRYPAAEVIEYLRKNQIGKTTAAGGRPREN